MSVAPVNDEANQPIQVLIVEDSDDQRNLLQTYFERANCSVASAKNAEEAIIAYGSHAPDLAVIDLVLPGIDGWELAERIREDVPSCAIAVTSVLDSRRYPEADAILPKPFTRAQVLQVLKDCVPRWNA
jgi:CheY-like chemotaxis protein